jgi:choline dehydrogenase-like flavoprotein
MAGNREERLYAGAVVVGSGAGGAVASALLAEGGADVLLLEEGEPIPPQGERSREVVQAMASLYRDGGITPVHGRPDLVFQEGRCLGGSTVVNGGMAWRTPSRVLERWHALDGAGTSPGSMEEWFDLVEEGSGVAVQPEETLSDAERAFREGAEGLGIAVLANRRVQTHCRGSGVCLLGCPQDRKQGAHVTWIPRAVAAGARVLTGVRVERILHTRGRVTGVTGHRIDPVTGDRGRPVRILTENVVVSCGALQTPVLLHRSRLAPRQVGHNLLLHPSVRVVGIHPRPLRQWAGVHQGLQIQQFMDEGILLACAGVPPGIAAVGLGGWGEKAFRRMEQFDRMLLSAALVEDSTTGRVRVLPGGIPWASYRLDDLAVKRIVRSVELLASIQFAAGAERVILPFDEGAEVDSPEALHALLRRGVDPAGIEAVTVHAMGTCAMGGHPARHPVDPQGRVRGVEGLVVADASVLPSSPGINPQISIQALAARTAMLLLERGGAALRAPGG